MMKSPRKEAIAKALAILIKSVNEENGSQLVSEDTSTLDSAAPGALFDAEEALDVTKSCFIENIDRLISDIRRRRNVAAPIHQFPPEVFITILTHLADAYSLEGKEYRILDLMTVNRTWREIIINSPQLWTTIRSDYPPEFANLVIERSKAHPLSLQWDTSASHYLDSDNDEFKDILELATRNSSRIRTMNVVVGRRSGKTLQRLLESSTPQLKILHAKASSDDVEWVTGTRSFTLSEGGPLKELALQWASVSNWSSWRISGLRLLDLSSLVKPPPIDQILRILSTSPDLEQLSLRSFSSPTSLPIVQWNESIVGGPIELPHLKKIQLEELPPVYYFSILSRIRPGVCNSVRVMEIGTADTNNMLNEELWRQRSDTMAVLLQLSKISTPTRAEHCSLSVVVEPWSFTIVNLVRTEAFQEPEKSIIRFSHTNAPRVTQVLGEFFSALNLETPPLRLQLEDALVWRDKPFDLRPWSNSLTMLQVKGRYLVRAVYRQLGQQWVSGDGTVTWLCPRLSFVDLNYKEEGYIDEDEEIDGKQLLDAVQRRGSGEYDIPAALRPSRFRIWCSGQRFVSIRSREEAIRPIVPSFEMY
ncbi:hypothetical protein FS837_004790 [Tulasnella sp. UAMH 9824]|nr:hypothetical protein FS837_004790 [Tulasnella sp. UAMH 9824]